MIDNQNLILEYKVLNYSAKYKLKVLEYDEETGKLKIEKVRLYYFFSNGTRNFHRYLENDGKIRIRLLGGAGGQVELGKAKLTLADFKSEYVTRKGFNLPIVGKNCFLRAIACIDST